MGNLKRQKTDGVRLYARIPVSLVRDSLLSLRAKGFLVLVLSLPEGWRFSVEGMAQIIPESKKVIYAILDELIKAGYVERADKKGKAGRFAGTDYIFKDSPLSPLRHTVPRHTAEPHAEKGSQKIKDIKEERIKRMEEGKKEKPPLQVKKGPRPEIDPVLLLQGRFPNVQFSREDLDLVSDLILDSRLWNEVLGIWTDKGYNGANIRGMLDRYRSEALTRGEYDSRGFLIHRTSKLEVPS